MIIALCDDDKKWLQRAEKMLMDYNETTQAGFQMISFTKGEEIEVYEGEPIEVLFLDIQLKEENGINIAEKVNKRWKNCQIVYLTNFLYYATEVYQTKHVYFVLKEQLKEKLGEIFWKVLHNRAQAEKKLIFTKVGGGQISYAPEEIRYFEHDKRTTLIHSVWGKSEVPGKMDEIMENLPAMDFARCHNSYIVYLLEILELQSDYLLLRDGNRIPISRRYRKSIKEAFAKWALTQIS